ncbi:DUF2330 domain-containing protein [Microlunatus soli]|uniref:DUF2330 domain-containing protein n=1 Tax=Microlunatus soli TaxID=630515 RepID=UPI0012FAC4D3|nr:DUF2330 domain-containing protein [Microlunatus soli]
MKRSRAAATVLLTVLLAGLDLTVAPAARACACGGFVAADGERMATSAEHAVISLDGDQERILLSMDTRTVTDDAALLIPTPAPAEAALAEKTVFAELKAATAPRYQIDHTWWPERDPGDGSAPGTPVGSSVDVLKTKQLGALEVTTLAATDADKLANWLTAHDYVMADSMATALQPYVADGWYYTAIRLTTDAADLSGALQPLDLTFASDSLIYPMRLSAAAPGSQFVRTYVFSDHQVRRSDRTAGRTNTSTYFAGQLPATAVTARSLTEIIATNDYLTVTDSYIGDPSEQIVSDFTFVRADQDRPYHKIIHQTRVRTVLGIPAGPAVVGIGVVLVAAGVIIGLGRIRRRRADQP